MKTNMKLSAVLLTLVMLTSVFIPAYSSQGLILSDPVYKDAGGNITDSPEPGFVRTEITAVNSSGSSASACLVVTATDKTTGKLEKINSAAAEIPANSSKTLSAGIEFTSNQTYNYYVWDNILNHTPLRNTPPADVKNLVCAAKTNSLDLSWDEALDDKGVKSYILKVNGIEAARSKEPSYSLPGLDRNSKYTCEVIASDEEGAESKTTAVIDAQTYGMEECILAVNDNPNITFYKNHSWTGGDSYTSADNIGGRDCYENTSTEQANGSKKTCFFYFPVQPTYINQTVRNVAFEITYYDEGSGSPAVQYNAEDGSSGKNCSVESKTDTKAWKTVHVQVNDAKFTNPDALTKSAFRISAPSGTRLYKVAVCPGDQYSPDAPNVKFGDNVTDIYDMYFYPEDAANTYGISYDSINGVDCMVAPNGSSFEFNINDACALRTGGYIEVNYFDEGDDNLVLNYTNVAGLKPTVPFTDTNEFRTVRIPLDAATFSNAIKGAAGKKFDFTLSTENGSRLALTSVRYVPGDSDYVAPPKTEVYAEVNSDGTALDGELELVSCEKYGVTADGYDNNILFSGKAGKEPQDGKHYLYNQEYTGFPSNKSWQRWKNAFYFKIPDSFIYDANYNHVVVEVEYYAPSGNIELLTKNASGSDQSAGKSAVDPGKWTTKYFDVYASDGKNIVFKNSLNGCDFRINFDCQGYISKVTVYRDDD